MASLTRFFISERKQFYFSAAVFAVVFLSLVAGLAHLGMSNIRSNLRDMANAELGEIVRLRSNALSALESLATHEAAPACDPAFLQILREVAFRPDGLNEFLYMPDNKVICSTRVDRFPQPILLPEPDFADVAPFGVSLWIDRPLDALELEGLKGTIVARGDFGAVVPPLLLGKGLPGWMDVELRTFAPDGRSWYRGGSQGLFETAKDEGFLSLSPVERICDHSIDCIVIRADLLHLASQFPGPPVGGIALAALLASLFAGMSRTWLARYWAFEARFRRNVNADSVFCVYQPIAEITAGTLIGCEVLARWRDLDGSVAYPDRFIPIVESSGLTLSFTSHVAKRAHRELTAAVPPDRKIQVNFNIFPADLHAEDLILAFEDFIDDRDRFQVVLEIIETDKIDLKKAGPEIEKLRAAGFQVFIDDFGTGYFSVENLVYLQVDGVKLDRCFAMAPERSVMARMLYIALEMIAATGRPVIVEGVETKEIMESLRSMPYLAQFAQGYGISRPIGADAFARMLIGTAGQASAAAEAA